MPVGWAGIGRPDSWTSKASCVSLPSHLVVDPYSGLWGIMDKAKKLYSVSKWVGLSFQLAALCTIAVVAVYFLASVDVYFTAHPLLSDPSLASSEFLAALDSKEQRLGSLDIPRIIMGVLALLIWWGWLYTSSRILREMDIAGLEHSPCMTVIWHVVPVMQLWKPMQVYVELAAASSGRKDWKDLRPSHLATLSAILLAILGLATVAHRRLLDRANDIAEWLSVFRFGMFIDILLAGTLIAMIFFLRMILGLQKTLVEGDTSLESGGNSAEPQTTSV